VSSAHVTEEQAFSATPRGFSPALARGDTGTTVEGLPISNGFYIAVIPDLADPVDVKKGDQQSETGSQPSTHPDKSDQPIGS